MENKKISMDIIVFSIGIISLICIFFYVAYSVLIARNININMNVIDAGYSINQDELKSKGSVNLYGMWKYYDGVHLISDDIQDCQPSGYSYIPMAWNMFDPTSWGKNGKSSYVLTLYNVPESENLTFYLHGIPQVYKIYINGELQKTNDKIRVRGASINSGETCEIVIEITSQWLTGLYACPTLYAKGVYENKMLFAKEIWAVTIGGFIVGFLVVIIFYRKFKDFPYTFSFIRNIILVFAFYEVFYIELSDDIQVLSEFISLERLHIIVVILSLLLVYFTLDFQVKLFDTVFDKKLIRYFLIPIFTIAFLKLFFGAYIDLSNIFICCVAALLIYVSICTYEGILRKIPGLIFVSIASGILCMTTIIANVLTSQKFFWFIYTLLPLLMLVAILCYVNYYAILFSIMEEAAAREEESARNLVNAEIAYLTSQIQPHFQYNALTTIQELCYTDSMKAAKAIGKYSSFLRKKIDFKNFSSLIPFKEEMNCVEEYMYIQELRFEDSIRLVTDVHFEDFSIPPMLLQTLVENAIHHGLRKKKSGGTVTIYTDRIDDRVIIRIQDDGIGFDINKLKSTTGQGIYNSNYRIRLLLDGILTVDSVENEGTTVTIEFDYDKRKGIYESNCS